MIDHAISMDFHPRHGTVMPITPKAVSYTHLDVYKRQVLDTVALMKGAHILRVHDVREAVEAVRITEKLKIESGYDK